MKAFFAVLTAAFAIAVYAQQPIKIGFVAELSGPQGALGQDQYDAFMLVVDRNGGRLRGGPGLVMKEGNQLQPEGADRIFGKLIAKENVSINTSVTMSTMPMAIHTK